LVKPSGGCRQDTPPIRFHNSVLKFRRPRVMGDTYLSGRQKGLILRNPLPDKGKMGQAMEGAG